MVAGHKATPADEMKGFFSQVDIKKDDGGTPVVTLLATTRTLLNRCADASEHGNIICADGGHKFTLLGWPVTVLGVSNAAGNFGVVALGITSGMSTDQLAAMFKSFRDRVVRSNPKFGGFALSMSDGEDAYRSGLAQGFGTVPLMCWFHIKQAAKKYIDNHAKGGAEAKRKIWGRLSEDMDVLGCYPEEMGDRTRRSSDAMGRQRVCQARFHFVFCQAVD